MSPSLFVDALSVAIVALLAVNGWRSGAARMAISTIALVAGVALAIVGRGPVVSALVAILPGVSPALLGLIVLCGGAWFFLALVSWLLGRTLRALLHAFGFGVIDAVVGALLGAAQAALLLSALVFLADAAVSTHAALPELISAASAAVHGSTAAGVARSTLFPVLGGVVAPFIPADLRALLNP